MKRILLGVLALMAVTAVALAAAGGDEGSDDRAAKAMRPDQKRVVETLQTALFGEKDKEPRSFALIVGISEFDRLPRLRGTQPEAETMTKVFAEQGFDVKRVGATGRLTRDELAQEVAEFVKRHGGKAENRLVIYFATHGYAAADAKDIGFLAASDTVRPGLSNFESTAYSVKQLSAALAGISAQHVFLFFNSCFSGAMLPELRADDETKTVARPPSLTPLSQEVLDWSIDLLSHNARMALTAGSDEQTVPDAGNPYAAAVVAGLNGEADADGDGLVLGTELAQFVRGRVARETRKKGKPNDAVFAILEKKAPPAEARPDGRTDVDYGLQGDFIFLSKKGPRDGAIEGRDELAEILAARAKRLPQGQFVECADCPVMVEMPGRKLALGRTEVTYAQWDACYRESGCRRFLPDHGEGRGDRPAAGMTWQDAYEFQAWLNGKKGEQCARYRLPTREEWLAADGVQAEYVGSLAEEGRAACAGCGPGRDEGRALAVASLPANALGLHDMAGNVWEWVEQADAPCGAAEFSGNGQCATPGMVLGGSYATDASSLVPGLEGFVPRTSNERPWSWPTVGMRIACEMK